MRREICADLISGSRTTCSDFATYKCSARNALGSTEGKIKLYGMSCLSSSDTRVTLWPTTSTEVRLAEGGRGIDASRHPARVQGEWLVERHSCCRSRQEALASLASMRKMVQPMISVRNRNDPLVILFVRSFPSREPLSPAPTRDPRSGHAARSSSSFSDIIFNEAKSIE